MCCSQHQSSSGEEEQSISPPSPPSAALPLPLPLPPPNSPTPSPQIFLLLPNSTLNSSPDLTKAASPSPGLRQGPGGGSSKPTFASALRDLAKNAGDGEPQRRPGPPTPTPVASTLQDVRKVRIEQFCVYRNALTSVMNIDALK